MDWIGEGDLWREDVKLLATKERGGGDAVEVRSTASFPAKTQRPAPPSDVWGRTTATSLPLLQLSITVRRALENRNRFKLDLRTENMNATRLMRLQPLRAAALRQPAMRQSLAQQPTLRQTRTFHKSRTVLREKVRAPSRNTIAVAC